MIAFACAHCGMKFQVKDQFAGRSTRCPTCKQPLTVPPPDRTKAHVPAGPIDGASSSLAQAGVAADVTLDGEEIRPGQKPAAELLARHAGRPERYAVESEIARGGMGAVLRAVDQDIRREVAVKFMLDDTDPRKQARFVEEAQITGQLEHPNIVPIHELAVDGRGRLFFSMKLVKGRSLSAVLASLRTEPRTAEKEWPLSRLLNVLVNVCHALAYAHSRGVVHRDLKPANIMLGDFGEVYVMDWGLAKVLKRHGASSATVASRAEAFASALGGQAPACVVTNREGEADLTQEGMIVGTPAYMPPEQACGQIAAIDPRSDVYSLGALLYEMLTLQPPVERDGGYVAVLMRVAEGQIVPPELRAPERSGRIPRELSAVALKALARDPTGRYPNVEAMRRDVERFQEGRSVSAKQDTVRELVWKLVKRNKGASLTAVAAVVLLVIVVGVSFRAVYRAGKRATDALAAKEQEERAKRERGRKSAPLFLEDARRSAQQGKLDHAWDQLDVALDFDPDNVEARLTRGQLLIARKEYAGAVKELERYLDRRRDDRDAAELLRLCRKGDGGDPALAHELAQVLFRQDAGGLAVLLVEDRNALLKEYRKKIDAAWPGLGEHLVLNGSELEFEAKGPKTKDVIETLRPLEGMPLTRLDLALCSRVKDLAPLRNMKKLATLNLRKCPEVRDLSPLADVPLTQLFLGGCEGVNSLRPLAGKQLTSLGIAGCTELPDLSALKGMPLTSLNLGYCKQFKDVAFNREFPRLTELQLNHCDVKDLQLLQGLRLTALYVGYNHEIKSLTPVQDMPLRQLALEGCTKIRDWSPLKAMPLGRLSVLGCRSFKDEDLARLKGKSMTHLSIFATGVTDLTPLEGMALETLCLEPGKIVRGMEVLNPEKMKSLHTIDVAAPPGKPGSRLSADEFWRRYKARLFK